MFCIIPTCGVSEQATNVNTYNNNLTLTVTAMQRTN